MTTLGFYGKLASRGDFVSRALPQSFIGPWDSWLAAGLLASQNSLGGDWLNAYLVSPLWRFVLAPGVCGPDAAAGVVMPSIDRVGRYFPLAVVALLDHDTNPASLVGGPDDPDPSLDERSTRRELARMAVVRPEVPVYPPIPGPPPPDVLARLCDAIVASGLDGANVAGLEARTPAQRAVLKDVMERLA